MHSLEYQINQLVDQIVRQKLDAFIEQQNKPSVERLYKISTVAQIMDCTRQHVYNHIDKGLKTVGDKHSKQIRESDLNDYIKNLK